MPIEVTGEALDMSSDWKGISKLVKRVRPRTAKACEDAMRQVLSQQGSDADAAVSAAIGATADSESPRASDDEKKA